MASSTCLGLILCIHFTLSLSHNHSQRHIIHECSDDHSRIIKGVNLHRVNVPYSNHPYASSVVGRRSMLTAADTSTIRISAYYDPVSVANALSAKNLAKLKASIGSIVSYYEKLIRVVPVSGTFYMERFCNSWYNSPYGKDCVLYNRGSPIYYCQYATIPQSHFAPQSLFFYPQNESMSMLSGRGISDTDLLLYITHYATESCGGSTLAHAGPCAYDQYGRPIAGNINVCNYFFQDHEWKTDTDTMLHEMTHITIMLSSLWDEFRDATGATIPEQDVYDDTVVPPILKTPTLLQMVRDHFNCPTAQGLPVQNVNSSHWHERYSFSEVMNPTTYSQQMYYSKFTLALMEDSGWYLPNYQYAMPYYFGKGAGCEWFTDDCIHKTSHSSNYPLYFCQSSADDGCNADYSAPSYCYYGTRNPPEEYQYFSDITQGGAEQSDYCPWRKPYFVANPDYEGVCHDVRGNTFETAPYYGEIWGSSSRCTVIKSTTSDTKWGYCFEHNCYDWDATTSKYAGVEIIFSSDLTIDCPQSDVGNEKTVTSNRAMVCPDVDVVCGTNSNFGACYWGFYSDTEGKCICNPGYTGTDCNSKDNTTVIELTLAEITTTPAPESFLCLSGFARFPSYNGNHWDYIGMRDYNPVYQSTTVSQFIWWHFWDHAWFISSSVGSSSYNCKCSVSEYTTDISDCNAQWICKSSTQSASQSLYGCVAPTTAQPTKAPTSSPTSSPTNNPTKSPTKKPTPNPTNIPTPSPTKYPTKSPTPAPTNNPTPAPTYNPTKAPTKNPTTASPTDDPTTGAPTVDGQTREPTVDPTLSPSPSPTLTPSVNPTVSPSNMPTKVSDFPTPSPTQVFVRNIVIDLQYQSTNDGACDMAQDMVSSIRAYVDPNIADLSDVVLDEVKLNVTGSMMFVEFALFSYSVNEFALNEMEARITSDVFQQDLVDDLGEKNEFNCFQFVDKIFSTIFTSDVEDKRDKNNDKNAWDFYDTEVHIFDFANYGTTEILVCILSGLILLICLVIIIYVCVKCKKCKKNKTKVQSRKSVEFGAMSSLKSDQLFQQSLVVTNEKNAAQNMHIVQATPSHIALPTNFNADDGVIDL